MESKDIYNGLAVKIIGGDDPVWENEYKIFIGKIGIVSNVVNERGSSIFRVVIQDFPYGGLFFNYEVEPLNQNGIN